MPTYDVVVISGSSAGVGAALAAGRMGARVALVEDTPVIGGMLANGVSNIDLYSLEASSGLFEEFRQAVKDYYRSQMSDPFFRTRTNMAMHLDGRSRQSNDPEEGGRWEPHVADMILKRMVAKTPSIDVFHNRVPTDVVKQGTRVVGVITESTADPTAYAPTAGGELVFHGNVIIDATHEADVAAWAGVPYRVGREARSRLEPHAGDIYFFNSTGEIMDGNGRQDGAIVSYGIRLCVQIYPRSSGTAHVLESPPPGYDSKKYEPTHISGLSEAIEPQIPNNKIELNYNPIGNEIQEINWRWPEANLAERRRLYRVYRDHAIGFLYYLQHEKGMTQLGLSDDEFIDNDGIPYRVFVREARRIEGECTVTEADINPFVLATSLIPPLRQDSIAIGHYPIDSKPVRAKTDLSTPDKGAGDFFLVNASAPFQVPYGAMVPKEIDGLVVPAALSATHVAFSAIRMDPTWMVLGQAAGVAAAISIRDGTTIRGAPVEKIQDELLSQRAKLVFYWDLPPDHPAFAAMQRMSVRGVLTGDADRHVRPDTSLTRAEMAAVVFRALDLWPSVSDAHFVDVPYDHWAFRFLETLFDHQALGAFGVTPRWPDAGPYRSHYAGFSNASRHEFGKILPDRPVTWEETASILDALTGRSSGREIGPRPNVGAPTKIAPGSYGGKMPTPQVKSAETITRGEFSLLVSELVWGTGTSASYSPS